MTDSDLIHIRVGKELKKKMEKLIEIGMFSTESEIAREAIRTLLIKYLKDLKLEESLLENDTKNLEKNDKKN